jgi:hypothetical protein
MFTHESRGKLRIPAFIVSVLMPTMWIASALAVGGFPLRASLPMTNT